MHVWKISRTHKHIWHVLIGLKQRLCRRVMQSEDWIGISRTTWLDRLTRAQIAAILACKRIRSGIICLFGHLLTNSASILQKFNFIYLFIYKKILFSLCLTSSKLPMHALPQNAEVSTATRNLKVEHSYLKVDQQGHAFLSHPYTYTTNTTRTIGGT